MIRVPRYQRTRRQRLNWLLLSALLLRFMIPPGFMPFAGPTGVYLGFCPGAGALPHGAAELATHATHPGHAHHSAGGGPESPGASHYPGCIFSAGAATVFAAVPTAALVTSVPTATVERVAARVSLPAILRAQSARGPPILA